MIAGRDFDRRDTRDINTTGVRAIIVNEFPARRYFGGRSPVGHRVGNGNRPDTAMTIEIVGLVEDFNARYVRDAPEQLFLPFAQTGSLAGDGTFYLRVRGEPESALASIRAAVAEVDTTVPLVGLTTIEDQITRALRSERMLATLSSGFGTVALVLSVVGLFGVMSFVVTQRTQEIGVGCARRTRSAAIWLIIRDALVTIGAGTVVAWPSA